MKLFYEMNNIFYGFIAIATILSSCEKPTNGCFTYSPTIITTTTAATFNASCTQNAIYYTWTFGDGTLDTTVTSALTVTHQYKMTGNYTVTLKTKRKDGMSFRDSHPTTTQSITVQ